MAESKVVLLKEWVDSLNNNLSPEDAAKVVYAIVNYSLYDKKIEIDKTLQPVVDSYYTQIDKILQKYPTGAKGRREKYDNEKIKELAARGMSVTDICKEMGVEYSRGIYSTKGYKEGHAQWLKVKDLYNGQDPMKFF